MTNTPESSKITASVKSACPTMTDAIPATTTVAKQPKLTPAQERVMRRIAYSLPAFLVDDSKITSTSFNFATLKGLAKHGFLEWSSAYLNNGYTLTQLGFEWIVENCNPFEGVE